MLVYFFLFPNLFQLSLPTSSILRVNRQERQHRSELVCSHGTYQTHFSFSSNHVLKGGGEYKSLHKDWKSLKYPVWKTEREGPCSSFQHKNAPFSKIWIVISLEKQGYISLLEGAKGGHSLLVQRVHFTSCSTKMTCKKLNKRII